MSNVKLDEISYWSEVKLDIIKKYAKAYSTIINAQSNIQRHLYIDGFAGAGIHISKRTREYILGSPLFYFFFAAGNPNGAPIAIRIAEHLMKNI